MNGFNGFRVKGFFGDLQSQLLEEFFEIFYLGRVFAFTWLNPVPFLFQVSRLRFRATGKFFV